MSEHVSKIFAEVSDSYDMVNSVSSLGVIILWRLAAAKEAMIEKKKYALLDIATGTGDLAFEISKKANAMHKNISITGMDFSPNMLKVAKNKEKKRDAGIKFELGDAMKLKYKDNSFDVVTSSFALRNVDDLNKFASEAKRVLKKNGKLVVLDISKPEKGNGKILFYVYIAYMSVLGAFTGKKLYKWLPGSTSTFSREEFIGILEKNRFRNIRIHEFFFGISYIISCNK